MAVGETLPRLLPLLSNVSVRSMLALAGPMALTSSRLTSLPLAPLVLRWRSSSLAYASVTVFMLGCPHGRYILGSIVAYLLRLLGVWLSSLLVGSCRLLDGDLLFLLLFCYFYCYCNCYCLLLVPTVDSQLMYKLAICNNISSYFTLIQLFNF